MEIKFLKDTKEEVEIEFDNITLPELLRVYLNEDPAVKFVAWKRIHHTKNPVFLVKTSGKSARTVINQAINQISKELTKLEDDFAKLK
jgi:DNA-directed RNA polymerase subunit L